MAKPETAGRIRERIEQVLDWAKLRGYRDSEIQRAGAAVALLKSGGA